MKYIVISALVLLGITASVLGYLIWTGVNDVRELRTSLAKVQEDFQRQGKDLQQHRDSSQASDARVKEMAATSTTALRDRSRFPLPSPPPFARATWSWG